MRFTIGKNATVLAFLAFTVFTAANAQETLPNDEALIYLGLGGAKQANETTNGNSPLSLGIMYLRNEGTFYGFDIAGEGTSLDSTYRRDKEPVQAFSYNLIIARNISKSDNKRFDGGLLLGFRQGAKDCPDSFIGYACYADTNPQIDYNVNYGAVLMYSFEKVSFGLRVTDASVQFLIGRKF